MSAANGAGGQAPTSASQGQAPQANNGSAPSGAPQGQAPDGNTSAPSGQQSQQLTAADYDRIIRELRDENAKHRTERSKIEKDLKAFQDAQLSDAQKLEKRATDAEAALTSYKQRVAAYAVQVEAQKLGIIDPELAALAIAGKLEFEDDGTPKNAEKLLKDLIAAKPFLAAPAAPQQPQRQPASSGGPVNPGTVARAGGTFTREQIARMSPREYEQNRAAIMEQLKSGGLRP